MAFCACWRCNDSTHPPGARPPYAARGARHVGLPDRRHRGGRQARQYPRGVGSDIVDGQPRMFLRSLLPLLPATRAHVFADHVACCSYRISSPRKARTVDGKSAIPWAEHKPTVALVHSQTRAAHLALTGTASPSAHGATVGPSARADRSRLAHRRRNAPTKHFRSVRMLPASTSLLGLYTLKRRCWRLTVESY